VIFLSMSLQDFITSSQIGTAIGAIVFVGIVFYFRKTEKNQVKAKK
jgi:hypothetical protein